MMPSYGYSFTANPKPKLPGSSGAPKAAVVDNGAQSLRSTSSNGSAPSTRSPRSRPTSMELEFNFSSLGYDNILSKPGPMASKESSSSLAIPATQSRPDAPEITDVGSSEVLYLPASHSSNMLTILDAIEKGNEKTTVTLDHSDDDMLSEQSSDDEAGLVFSPRPIRRASSAIDMKKLNAPQAQGLRGSNSMSNLPRARGGLELPAGAAPGGKSKPSGPGDMRPELKRQYSTPTMGGLRPTKKTPSTLSPGQARLSTSRPTSPRMSNIRGASPKPHRGSLQLKFESVESRGRDGEFENVQMR